MLNDPGHLKMSVNPTILFLSSWYPTNENPSHGIFIREQAKALSIYTPVISIYAYSSVESTTTSIQETTHANLTELLLCYPKTKISIPVIKQFVQYIQYRSAYKKLLAHLIQKKITISAIQVNVAFPASMILPLFKKHYEVKHSVSEHWSGYLPEDGNYKGVLVPYFTEKCIASASKIFYVSEKQKESMQAHDLNGRFELLYNVVNVTLFKPLPIEKNKVITFLHVSSLVEREKNVTGTFEALKILQEKGRAFNLIVIGGNSESIKEAKTKQAADGLKNVEYLGYQTKEMICRYMNQCHALLLYSNFEGMPVVALEALACGLPVFASEVGQLPNIIRSEFGVICKKNNSELFAEQLETIFTGKHSFDEKAMRNFVIQHASAEAVGKQLYTSYSAAK
jgi:glycosyltransferase involved in cell wall biosynthesis